ncbi:MAG: glycosyltransferase [Fibrobacterales bacterium]
MSMIRVSIITAVYNNEASIRDAIESVLSQDYPHIEYVVIDGGSTDATRSIIDEYQEQIATYVSEADGGIYDALNKGVHCATGDLIGFMHSDDLFGDASVISQIVATYERSGADGVYGDLEYVQQNDTSQIIRYWKSAPFERAALKKGWMIPHPTLYLDSKVYEEYGVFDTGLRISADYEFMLRILTKPALSFAYIPSVLVKMRVGGASNSFGNLIKKSKEDLKTLRKHNVGGVYTLLYKIVSKLSQFVHRRGG